MPPVTRGGFRGPGRDAMAPTGKGFAYGVSLALVLILVGTPVAIAGMVLREPALVGTGSAMIGVGAFAVVVLFVALSSRNEAKS